MNMNLADIYAAEGSAGLKRLATKAGSNYDYLYQLATGFRNKRPSSRLARRLIAADPRISFDALYRDEQDQAA